MYTFEICESYCRLVKFLPPPLFDSCLPVHLSCMLQVMLGFFPHFGFLLFSVLFRGMFVWPSFSFIGVSPVGFRIKQLSDTQISPITFLSFLQPALQVSVLSLLTFSHALSAHFEVDLDLKLEIFQLLISAYR